VRLSTPWCWIEHQEIVIHLFVDLHYSSLVTAAITVVWCGEYCDNLLLVAPIVSCHDKLMCSGYRLKAIFLYKLIRDVLSEGVAGATWGDTPPRSIVRI